MAVIVFLREAFGSAGSAEASLLLLTGSVVRSAAAHRSFAGLERVSCSPGQLSQVFMSLIRNAVEAIEGEGEEDVSTIDEGNCVAVRIRRTGVGVPQERLTTIFAPSFSARGSRVRMGTGLTTALRVVQTHGGELDIDSRERDDGDASERGKRREITASRVR